MDTLPSKIPDLVNDQQGLSEKINGLILREHLQKNLVLTIKHEGLLS